MIRGTRKSSPLRSGALASIASCEKHGSSTSSRMTLTTSTACEVGSTPVVSTRRSVSRWARIEFSCSRMRSSSASVRCSRVRRATCSTSLRSIIGSQLLEVSVLHREALAPHAGEADRHDVVAAVALDADDEPLAEARMAHPRAHAERQVLGDGVRCGRVGGGIGGPAGRRLAPNVQRGQLILAHLAQEARGLADAVAVNPPVQRVREVEALAGPREPDVAEAALLLDLLLVVHRARVREDPFFETGQEDRGELQALGR